MTSQTGQRIIRIHILPNISRSKGNQAIIEINHEIIKFSQLIKYSVRNIFFQNQGRMQGAAIAANAAPRNGSH